MLAMTLASCSSESIEADVVSGEKLVVGTTIDVSGSASADNTIPVEANCGWQVKSDVSWITVTKPEAGLGNGSGNVVFDVAESLLSTDQTGHLTITTDGGMPRIITVTQRAGKIWLQATPSTLFFTYDGGEQRMQVTCNSSYTVTSSAGWLKVDGESILTAEGDRTFTVRADPNPNPDGMTAVITIADIHHKVEQSTIPVEIGGKSTMLTVTATSNVAPTGGVVTFGVESNFQWEANITRLEPQGDELWAAFDNGLQHQEGEPASEPIPVQVKVAPNTSETERLITILIQTKSIIGDNKRHELTIRQEGGTRPVVYTPHATSVGMTDATLTFVTTSSTFGVKERGILYSTNPDAVHEGTLIKGALTGDEAATVLTGLNPGTTYYVCGFARNDVGTTYSGTTSFKTRLTPGRDNNPTP